MHMHVGPVFFVWKGGSQTQTGTTHPPAKERAAERVHSPIPTCGKQEFGRCMIYFIGHCALGWYDVSTSVLLTYFAGY